MDNLTKIWAQQSDVSDSRFHHIRNPHPYRPAADLSKFYIVTTLSNAWRYQRRYELYWRFQEMCAGADVKLITVEQAFGLRPFMVTKEDETHLQVRTVEELWHKENMLNLGIQRAVDLGAREVAWIDADCRPMMPARRWFEETWHLLQHYEFLQMFETLVELNLNEKIIAGPYDGFMANFINKHKPNPSYDYKGFGGPGLAWAANVDALNKVGGLIDYCILGACDWFMAHALVGGIKTVASPQYAPSFLRRINQWETLCERWVKRDVGFVPVTVGHEFHGAKTLRLYATREQILINCKFDPDVDLKYDSQGLLQLETWDARQIQLRDQVRNYFRNRNDDSTTGGE